MNIGAWLERVREQRPLVHNITNLVVNHIAANALLSIGASPVMAYAHEEVSEMAAIAGAVALNMGTLTPEVVVAMRLAGQSANRAHVPVVFDPVGIGATSYRTLVAQELAKELHFTVLRGNSGEMSGFLGAGGAVKGVDSVSASSSLPQQMKEFAANQIMVLVATGEVDVVTDGISVWKLSNGHPLLSAITGSGCMLTAILGAFAAVVPKGSDVTAYAQACISAITSYNVAAEIAAQKSDGPGTFHTHLFDALYALSPAEVSKRAKVEQIL